MDSIGKRFADKLAGASALSTGHPSTLGSYRKLACAVFGEDSAPVKFLDSKIAESPGKENEIVVADERQMINLLGTMFVGEKKQ